MIRRKMGPESEVELDRLLSGWAQETRLSAAEFNAIKVSARATQQTVVLDARWWKDVFAAGSQPLRQSLRVTPFASTA